MTELNPDHNHTEDCYKSGCPEFIDPINYYTGSVSVLAIFKNEKNGYTKFPSNMGVTIKSPV